MFFITNTGSKTPAQCVSKMNTMGYVNAKVNHVYTMASVIAKYVKRVYPNVRKVFCVGMQSMRECLEAEGIEVLGSDR